MSFEVVSHLIYLIFVFCLFSWFIGFFLSIFLRSKSNDVYENATSRTWHILGFHQMVVFSLKRGVKIELLS